MLKITKKVKSNFILKLFEKDHDDTLQKTYRLEEILVRLRLEPLVFYLSLEHQDFRRQVARFKLLLSRLSKKKVPFEVVGKLKETGIYLVHLLRAHLQGEREILCKVADRDLGQDEKKELKRRFQQWIKQRLRRRS